MSFVKRQIAKTSIGSIQGTSICLRNRFLFFCNEHAQSTTIGPKPMFWEVSRYFVDDPDLLRKLVSGCIWLNVLEQWDSWHTTWKISMHSFRTKTHILGIFTPFRCYKTSVWFHTTYFWSKTRVLGGFTPLRCRTWPVQKISIRVYLIHEFMPPKPILILSQRTSPIHYFRSKTHVLGGSMPFRSRTRHVAKTGIEVDLMDDFMPLELFLVFLQQTCPIHYFRSKTHVLMVSRHFVATPNPWKLVSGCV